MRDTAELELVLEGEGGALQLPLVPGGSWTVGRDPGCAVILDDPRVSAQHACISWEQGRLQVVDLDSVHGIRVDGREVVQASLRAGSLIEIREYRLEIRAREAPAASAGREALLVALGALLRAGEETLEVALGRMLAGLTVLLGADRGIVFGAGRGPGGFARLKVHVRGDGVPAEEPVSETVLRRAAGGEEVLLASEETVALQQEVASVAAELRSLVAVPLAVPGGGGVLYLDSVRSRRRFTEADKEFLAAFARSSQALLVEDRARRRRLRRAEQLGELQRRQLAAAEMVGESAAMKEVFAEVARVAAAPVPVLVTGESGTGKELTARALHRSSDRAEGPFVAVNAAAIPADLVESELFGAEKGAFTGAGEARPGYFELAHGGTLFLDEVGELPVELQGKLLRVLEERKVRRLGGREDRPVDFRLVSATNVDLEAAVTERRFREDLFYRIAVYRIRLPALRERGRDVVLIAERLMRRAAKEFRRPLLGLHEELPDLLMAQPWPGNVRQLRNVIEQAVLRETGEWLRAPALRAGLGDPVPAGEGGAGAPGLALPSLPEELAEARKVFDRAFLERALARAEGNMKAAAGALGMARKTLYAKCDELGIDYRSYRG